MKYLAHKDDEREQLLIDHLKGTAEYAASFAGKFGNGDWGYCEGMTHDVGKYEPAYQEKINGNKDLKVDHSTAGAKECAALGGLYWYMSFCVAGHHAGLPDLGRRGLPSSLNDRLKKNIPEYSDYKKEIRIPEVTSMPFPIEQAKSPGFSMSVFIRMLFSCLVDADYLDTERFMSNGKIKRDPGISMKLLNDKLQDYISEWLMNNDTDTINGRRTEILKNCLEEGISPRGLFQLTVPTGGGKTIASIAFALKHAIENNLDRIIYVIPYTSIIEQNAQVFRNIFGYENVLENHSNVEYSDTEDFNSMKLAAENWDKPIVVTTNVQFFESLYSNRPSKCRKLHNIVNSVIIFDEAQMLPINYLKPCIAIMEELLTKYKTSIVLCTATQPALQSFFSERYIAKELCPRREEQFHFFERTSLIDLGTVTEEQMVEKLNKDKQTLCIVNTRKRAQRLYDELKEDGVYHLSTSMYPAHRRRVLEEIRDRLKDPNKTCIVVSTSLVEAGVDLDFQTVYRELAGVDSIIQAGGRCNRNGKYKRENSIVGVFQWEDKEKVPDQRQQTDVAKTLLAEGRNLSELSTITEYFSRLYHIKGESLDCKKILEGLENNEYNFATVSKEFKLIEQNTVSIYINKEPAADELLREIRQRGLTKELVRKAGQYCVNVYQGDGKQTALFEKMYYAGMLRPIAEGAEDWYELIDCEQYRMETGLILDVESGVMNII